MSATSIVEEDDEVVAAALSVLDEDAPEGTDNLRRGETNEGAAFVYRIDADADGEIDANRVEAGGDFPDAEAAAWRANRYEVEREADRRDIGATGRATEGGGGGNR